MKKTYGFFLALLLVVVMLPMYACAETVVEEPFTMWNGIQFGDTIDEVREKCELKEGAKFEELDYNLNGRPTHYYRSKTEVDGVMAQLRFYFDENGKLTDFLLENLQDFETKRISQDRIAYTLTQEYGDFEVGGKDAYEKFPGIVIDELARQQMEFVSDDTYIREYTTDRFHCIGWMVPLEDGGAAKIECVYEEHTKDQKCIGGNDLMKSMGTWTETGNCLLWGYSYLSSEKLGPLQKDEKNSSQNTEQLSDWEIIAQAKELYDMTNQYGRLWPADYDLTRAAGVHSVRNVSVASCEIGTLSDTYATVLFKGNFSGYDEYGMFVSRYTFTAEVNCTIKESGYIDVDLLGADYRVQKV